MYSIASRSKYACFTRIAALYSRTHAQWYITHYSRYTLYLPFAAARWLLASSAAFSLPIYESYNSDSSSVKL